MDTASVSDAWAVGSRTRAGTARTLVLHWNGTAWRTQQSPNVGTGDNDLTDVAVSAAGVWAVGSYADPAGRRRTLIERWDGTRWSVQKSPNVGTGDNVLRGVAAASASDAWAVGSYSDRGVSKTLVLHWNGTAWSVGKSANVGTGDNVLNDVAAASRKSVWAVGSYGADNGPRTLVERWNGRAWRVQESPSPGDAFDFLDGVTMVSGTNGWAVGSYANSTGPLGRTLVEHWDGTAWTVQPSPDVGTGANHLSGLSATSAGEAWAERIAPPAAAKFSSGNATAGVRPATRSRSPLRVRLGAQRATFSTSTVTVAARPFYTARWIVSMSVATLRTFRGLGTPGTPSKSMSLTLTRVSLSTGTE